MWYRPRGGHRATCQCTIRSVQGQHLQGLCGIQLALTKFFHHVLSGAFVLDVNYNVLCKPIREVGIQSGHSKDNAERRRSLVSLFAKLGTALMWPYILSSSTLDGLVKSGECFGHLFSSFLACPSSNSFPVTSQRCPSPLAFLPFQGKSR